MSSEIVPFVDGSDDTGKKGKAVQKYGDMSSEIVDGISPDDSGGQHSNVRRPPQRLGEYIPALDLFRGAAKPWLQSHLVGGHDQISKFLASEKGHKHVTQLSPTPSSVNAIVDQIKIPSVLLLHGCDQLFLQPADFPFAKFKTLTCLEISSVTNLTTLPRKAISEMTQLQTLNLSYLPIQQLPEDDFLSSLTDLRSLVLRGCSDLHFLPKFPQLSALQSLDLSHLLIETLPEGIFSVLKELRWVIISGCSKLLSLPSTEPLEDLRVLDLSHCTALHEMEYIEFVHPHLKVLDISSTAFLCSPNLDKIPKAAGLFFRDTKMTKLNGYSQWNEVIDLSGAQNLKVLDCFPRISALEALDLSRTEIDSLDFFSILPEIRYLILRECNRLRKLPSVGSLQISELEVLDISGCEILVDLPEDLNRLNCLKELNLSRCICLKELREGLFDQMPCLEKLDLSKTQITHLPSFSNLASLRTLNISHTSVEQVPGLSNLEKLKDFFFADCPRLKGVPARFQTLSNELHPSCRLEGRMSMSNQLHLVSTFFNESGFDRFKQGFSTLVSLISKFQERASQTLESRLRSMIVGLDYIRNKIDHLESSNNCTSADELLNSLIDIDTSSRYFFNPVTPNLDELFQTIIKLKLLVPPPPTQLTALEKRKKKKKEKEKLSDIEKLAEISVLDTREKIILRSFMWTLKDSSNSYVSETDLCSSYDSLTELQRNCLLCFAVFPFTQKIEKQVWEQVSVINERILIQLWYAEGFIDPGQEENDASRVWEQVSTTKEVENQNTIEEIGRKILIVLQKERFILRPVPHYGKLRICSMLNYAMNFVRERAKECLFEFDYKNGKLAPDFNRGSKWACMLKPRENLASSSKLPNSFSKLRNLETIDTLFNATEHNINMRADIFSKMNNLNVLHLGRWGYLDDELIEVVDLKFLEELKNMKHLRLLSLEGFPTIKKLPDSVCKVTSLKILNLRECSYLEKLPDGIGSLKNLTHLDLTDCHVLCNLPKGLRLLSNLEVLKGFMITYQIGGRQHRNACTLRDLLKLEKLRKLNLVVNTEKFPSSKDIQVFKKMKNLCNLKMTWENDYDRDQEPQDVVGHSRLQQLKCWEQQTRESDKEESLRSNDHLDKLKKLVLCCFPLETAPNWLNPSELRKLEKLYIVGGEFKSFAGDANQITWSVKTLCFKYLLYLHVDWKELKRSFSNMTNFRQYNCSTNNCPVCFQSVPEREGLEETDVVFVPSDVYLTGTLDYEPRPF